MITPETISKRSILLLQTVHVWKKSRIESKIVAGNWRLGSNTDQLLQLMQITDDDGVIAEWINRPAEEIRHLRIEAVGVLLGEYVEICRNMAGRKMR